MPAQQSRRWSFTLYPEGSSDVYRTQFEQSVKEGDIVFICFGNEVCPDTGRRHMQGYVELPKKKSLGGVKKVLGSDTVHVEVSKGTAEHNIEYCKKEGDYWCTGKSIEASSKSYQMRLQDAQQMLKSGGSLLEIAETDFALYLQHSRGLQLYSTLLAEHRSEPTVGFWIWGPTGTGKSRRANEHSRTAYHSVHIQADNNCKWFDGYAGQEALILDDITPEESPKIGTLLRMLDRYPMSVPVKGGFANFRPRAVYITSNYSPCEIYGGNQLAALMRRLDTVIHLK